jgi:hypothetical protein
MDCVPLPVDDVPILDRPMAITHTVMEINIEYHNTSNPVL